MDSHARHDREREFHDHRDAQGSRTRARRFYSVTRASQAAFDGMLSRYSSANRVLDFGCGRGVLARRMAREHASVVGIDISPVVIDQARRETAAEGDVEVEFRVMDGEHLEFEDGAFDLVVASGVLHHLDLEIALREIVRVLRPGAPALFVEPLGHNPFVNLYRRFTPKARSSDERPLRMVDLLAIERHFPTVRTQVFHCAVLAAVPFRHLRIFAPLLRVLEAVDRVLLRWKTLARFGWIAVIEAVRS